ncbi:tetrapyrrole methylase family protein / MazG family protein [Peptoniphilus asaccharolyticus DSM 20463]|uniref:Tetrapyrrole methylase family protein / MazG family protein n=1 Tax=Peptoniphilus asaccharolyticus DSM 20463 TaxID=573058 RepID=A0A1W1UJD4_PEPAS|nr:SAM-dependent methyltransferase [Peptoniphilus asaccharolyticus]MBL7574803.1 tetrapyrrole methylase [Peptoniphilus asaccharolyticus]SMB81149.1 tetrapyrrole methylase family protein / MazG family protein [Peptoniphilus asaccharolyticus DSM 20463]
MINIIGLGATDEYGITLQALEFIKDKNPNYLRTEKVDAIKKFNEIGAEYSTFDYLYESEDTFEEVYNKIVETLINESKQREINYFVPGTPLIAERTVLKLIESRVEINLVAGVSFIEHILNAVKRDPSNGFMLLDADDFSSFNINTKLDIAITQVYNMRTAVDLKLALSEIYGDEYQVYFIKNAGLSDEVVEKISVYEMDRMQYNHQCVIYVPKSNIIGFGDILQKYREEGKKMDADVEELVLNLKKDLETLVAIDANGDSYIYDILQEVYNKNV